MRFKEGKIPSSSTFSSSVRSTSGREERAERSSRVNSVSSEGSSSRIRGSLRVCFSLVRAVVGRELLEENDRMERLEESMGAKVVEGERGGMLQLLPDLLMMLEIVAVDSRREEFTESLEALRDRAAEMNMRVSCSVMEEGPGTGGKGEVGGREGGGPGWGRAAKRGLVGMKVGGAGKDERRRGTALRLSRRRDWVGEVVDIA